MKTIRSTFLLLAVMAVAVTGCKNQGKEAKTEEAKEAKQANVEAAEFEVDSETSEIHWQGKKPTGTHTGTIQIAEGSFSANDSIIESGSFVIDMQSIEVTDLEGKDKEDLEAHLMGTVEGKEGDFFNTQKYPEATFEITGLNEENGEMMLSGNLTIKEKTKNITFPVSIDHSGNQVKISTEEFTINRTNWDVNFGSKSVFDDLGDNFVNDDIQLRLDIVANKA